MVEVHLKLEVKLNVENLKNNRGSTCNYINPISG